MGQVWKARDTRLNRIVALKVSKREFTERFEREARAISALNHPHICQLYDVGPNYLVMEFAEGEPLLTSRKPGPLPVEKALEYSRQILDALDHAHRHKITHRDLKPSNIMVTRQGVKLLDFGLAKLETNPLQETDETLTQALTKQGQIVGTLQYMSPEQLQGKPADARSDIFSFGAVLYEMLSGKRAFEGSSAASVIAAVLERQPAPLELSPPLDRIIRACLEKDPEQRMQTAREAKWALEWAAEPNLKSVEKNASSRSHFGVAVAAAAMFLLVAAMLGWIAWRATRPVEHPLARLDVDLGRDVALPLPVGGASDIAISPDGTRIVYTVKADPSATSTLYVRKLDQAKATELAKGSNPVFSPDGQWIAFENFTSGSSQLSKIAVDGGAVVPVTAEKATGYGVGWGEDAGFIMPQLGKGLVRIGPAGSNPETLTELSPGEALHSYPKVLPGDKAVLFVTQAGLAADDDSKAIEAVTLAGHRRKVLVRGGTSPRYLPTGHLIYTNKSTLFAIPFDLDKLEVRGAAVPLVSDIAAGALGVGQFDLSATGTLIYRKAEAAAMNSTIQWTDPSGKNQPLLAKPGRYADLRFSPDRKRLALLIGEVGQADLWVYDIQRDTMTRLTSGGSALAPEWSPDGRHIAFSRSTGGLSFTRSDGAMQPQALQPGRAQQVPSSFSPDGRRLAYTELAGAVQIWTVPLEEQGGLPKAGQPEQFLKSRSIDAVARFSPDGRWLAYISNESGKYEIYVRPYPPPASGQGGKWQISNGGATHGPWWAHNGHELYYQQGDQLMAVSYTTKGDTFIQEKPRVWIPKLGGTIIDVASDDKRVAVITPVASPETPQQEHTVVFLFNFLDYLKKQVPLNK
jgi:serine/threonine-protein kinase